MNRFVTFLTIIVFISSTALGVMKGAVLSSRKMLKECITEAYYVIPPIKEDTIKLINELLGGVGVLNNDSCDFVTIGNINLVDWRAVYTSTGHLYAFPSDSSFLVANNDSAFLNNLHCFVLEYQPPFYYDGIESSFNTCQYTPNRYREDGFIRDEFQLNGLYTLYLVKAAAYHANNNFIYSLSISYSDLFKPGVDIKKHIFPGLLDNEYIRMITPTPPHDFIPVQPMAMCGLSILEDSMIKNNPPLKAVIKRYLDYRNHGIPNKNGGLQCVPVAIVTFQEYSIDNQVVHIIGSDDRHSRYLIPDSIPNVIADNYQIDKRLISLGQNNAEICIEPREFLIYMIMEEDRKPQIYAVPLISS